MASAASAMSTTANAADRVARASWRRCAARQPRRLRALRPGAPPSSCRSSAPASAPPSAGTLGEPYALALPCRSRRPRSSRSTARRTRRPPLAQRPARRARLRLIDQLLPPPPTGSAAVVAAEGGRWRRGSRRSRRTRRRRRSARSLRCATSRSCRGRCSSSRSSKARSRSGCLGSASTPPSYRRCCRRARARRGRLDGRLAHAHVGPRSGRDRGTRSRSAAAAPRGRRADGRRRPRSARRARPGCRPSGTRACCATGCAASATTPTRWRRRRAPRRVRVRRVAAVLDALGVGWDLKQVHLDGDGGFLERGSGGDLDCRCEPRFWSVTHVSLSLSGSFSIPPQVHRAARAAGEQGLAGDPNLIGIALRGTEWARYRQSMRQQSPTSIPIGAARDVPRAHDNNYFCAVGAVDAVTLAMASPSFYPGDTVPPDAESRALLAPRPNRESKPPLILSTILPCPGAAATGLRRARGGDARAWRPTERRAAARCGVDRAACYLHSAGPHLARGGAARVTTPRAAAPARPRTRGALPTGRRLADLAAAAHCHPREPPPPQHRVRALAPRVARARARGWCDRCPLVDSSTLAHARSQSGARGPPSAAGHLASARLATRAARPRAGSAAAALVVLDSGGAARPPRRPRTRACATAARRRGDAPRALAHALARRSPRR